MFAFELVHGHEEHLVMIQRQTDSDSFVSFPRQLEAVARLTRGVLVSSL